MTMSSGTRLGPYEIVAPIGAGGMGEVYRARDTRLDRAVAIKILPPAFAQNSQFKLRFEREAKTISQLSHPHICTLFDVGENYIVMELLDGETLADRLAKGPLPLADVLKYGAQIAQALARAHRAGIVHRDLKPGNIMLTKDGAKLLDFGLAKGGGQPPSAVHDATEQKPLTAEGTLVGTFQYMAPEQLAGEEPDARTDIFALGVVLYEMATGRRAFEGKTKTSLIAAILSGEPRPMSEMQPLTPRALEHVVKKCLAKEPDDRWQNASDIAEELRWIEEGESTTPKRPRMRSAYFGLVAVALIVGGAIGTYFGTRGRAVPRLISTQINSPPQATFEFDSGTAVLSPDGSKIAFVAKPRDGAPLLWVRPLEGVAVPLKGTENALFPFWSPDSKSLAFFSDGKLRRIDAAGGSPEIVANAPTARGGSWGKDNIIVFSPTPQGPLFRVPASGGEEQQVTTVDIEHSETSHRFPAFLPDGRHFLAYVQGIPEGNKNILLGSLDSKESRRLMRADCGVVFAGPDYVLFMRGGSLRAQRIDLKTFDLIGDPLTVSEGGRASSTLNFANVSASNDGSLAFVEGSPASVSVLKMLDAHGNELETIGKPSDQLDPRMAPDGHAIATARADGSGILHIWLFDLRRNVEGRLTSSSGHEWTPVWSPDSKSIVYTSFDKRPGDLFIKRVDSSDLPQPLLSDKRRKVATDWSRDGKYIVYHAQTPPTQWDIEAYSLTEKKIIPVLHGPAQVTGGRLSSDGQWLAYASDASGIQEIYVQRFLSPTDKWQISSGGGAMPSWSGDGHDIYYISRDGKLMAATVHRENGFVADAPRVLFEVHVRAIFGLTRNQYDVVANQRFLINTRSDERQTASITLVQNWRAKFTR